MKRFVVTLCVVMVCTGISFAKGASAKQGSPASSSAPGKDALGITFQINGGVNFVTYRHWSAGKSFIDGAEGLLAFNKNSNVTTTDLAVKLMHSIKREQNLTAYSFGMFGIEPYSGTNTTSGTNTFAAIGLGVEYFIQGVPNLSVSAEAGFGYSSPNSQYGTSAGALPLFGLRYYLK
jgi:hypothetical protein